MNDIVKIDDAQIRDLFADLSERKLQNILYGAIKKGAKVIKENTIIKLRTKINTSAKSTGTSIEDGVRMKGRKNYMEANVNIMGDYRLIFLEQGTKLRKTKSGANRGKITARNFFADARMNETAVYNAIDEHIKKSLQRIQK